MSEVSEDDIKRFWRFVDKTNDCWVWMGSQNGTEYGKFWLKEKTIYAHRISYFLEYGAIKDGNEIDHLCKNRRCVNPLHLEEVTGKINRNRGDSFSGKNIERTHCSKGHELTEDNLCEKYLERGQRVCKTCKKEQDDKRKKDLELGLDFNHNLVLNNEKVIEILKLSKNGLSGIKIANIFGIHHATVYNILNGDSWKHIDRNKI
jgi:hypothetical protein